MVGRAEAEDVPEACGTVTRSERQTPRPDIVALQFAVVHVPPWRTCEELEQARQLLGPEPEQLEQLESQD